MQQKKKSKNVKKVTEPETRLSESEGFKVLQETLSSAKRILITTHELPDGDGLGAEAALYHYLKRARKSCRVYNPDPLPPRYRVLDPKENILMGPGQVEIWDTFDLWIILDTNDPRRVGKLWNELSLRARKIVFLDHHPKLIEDSPIVIPPHATMVTDTQSSSIGELLYQLFQDLDLGKINADVALGLYVSIMTDTNSFRYARTTPGAHRICAELIELGVDPEAVYQAIFSSKEVSHLQLLGYLLQNVKTAAKGRLAWMEMTREIRQTYQASADDTQSFLNLLLLLKDSEIVCLYREEDVGDVRVSMRSKGKVTINRIAEQFGGGGHEFAAGLALDKPLPELVNDLNTKLVEAIDRFERFGKN